MRYFELHYEGERYPVQASNHEAARRLGTLHLANMLGAVNLDKIAVIDVELSAGYRPKRYQDVTLSFNEVADVEIKKVLADHFLNGPTVAERRVDLFRRKRMDFLNA